MSDAATAEETLLYTQQMRRRLVSHIVGTNGSKMPDDPKEAKVLLTALSDMDRQVLALKKIESDQGLGDKQLQAAAIIGEIFNDKRLENFNRIPLKEGAGLTGTPVLGDDLPPVPVVDGELSALGLPESYEVFLSRTSLRNDSTAVGD